jgi:hypothetical protein
MFLDVEWPGVQGEPVAERGNTISWETPLHELAHREGYYLDEKDADDDKGHWMNGEYDKSEKIREPRTSQRNDDVEGRNDRG